MKSLPEKGDMDAHINSWNAHFLTIDRKKCWVLTHNFTRYTVVIPDVTAKKADDLRWLFMDQIINQYLKDNQRINFTANVNPADFEGFFGEFEYYPTNNDKSCIAYVNQRVKDLEMYIYDVGYEDIPFYRVGALMNQFGKVKRDGKAKYIDPAKEMLEHIKNNRR